jgi:hypothetical protein
MEVAPSWALLTVAVLFTFFPLSLAYTVIVQRALDLRIILRQGTRYAFARGTLWVLQTIVFTFLGFRLFHFAMPPAAWPSSSPRGIRRRRPVSAPAHCPASFPMD